MQQGVGGRKVGKEGETELFVSWNISLHALQKNVIFDVSRVAQWYER